MAENRDMEGERERGREGDKGERRKGGKTGTYDSLGGRLKFLTCIIVVT